MTEPTRWTLKGFLSHFRFVHNKMPDHAFAWVLGAGASRASGILTGGELVKRWLSELHERLAEPDQPIEKWATAENLDIKGFTYADAASFYPRIYERRFRDHPEEGFACLEELMEGKDPSPGYSILAKIMEKARHRVVITTNFDNLVADALAIYTDTYPFICGHEALTGFVRTAMRRPLVCKIHRDLLLGPKNDPRSLKRLHDAWGAALRSLLAQYTPIFIGYGGNDDSLMDLLGSLDPDEIKGQLVWCYYEKSEPNDRIKELIVQHRGVLVPVPDFDLFMILLGSELGIEPLDATIEERARARADKYRNRILALDTTKHPDVATALASTAVRAGWPVVVLKANNEPNLDERYKIYQQGLQQFPQSSNLYVHFSNFLVSSWYRLDEAEILLHAAIELEPQNPYALAAMAALMVEKRNFPEAERRYKQVLEILPDWYSVLADYAYLLAFVEKNDEAYKNYLRAFRLAPQDFSVIWGLVAFNIKVGNLDLAHQLVVVAQELFPGGYIWVSGGILLIQGRFQEAANVIRQSLNLVPDVMVNRFSAERALYAALVERCQGQDDTDALIRLKALLRNCFVRYVWLIKRALLEAVKPHISHEDFNLYSAIAEAIHDAKAVPNLDNFERWRSLPPATHA